MAKPLVADPLIGSKLRRPTLPHLYRPRPRVSEQLDAALADATRLTLVSAPAGYGKSVAVAAWLAERDLPAAWLGLDAADNDVTRFVRYLVAALRPLRPESGDRTLDLVATGSSPSVERIGAMLLDEIAATDDPFVLVLDDCHVLRGGLGTDLLGLLVANLPPFAHPVLVSRADPPVPLARLRAHQRLLEIRAADLRYTPGEVTAYLHETRVNGLSTRDIERLVERTEGWPAGLALAAMSLRRRADAGAFVDELTISPRAVFEYLADEVMAGLDAGLREFLVRTSPADYLTPALCEELTGRSDAAAMLARVERDNLFLTPLNPTGTAFRFHQLFGDYLRSLLDDTLRVEIHGRIAAYLERSGLTQEAIAHAIAAGDVERAVRLVEREARPAFEAGELTTLIGWLESLPAERVAASPELTSLRAWSLLFMGRLAEAAEIASGVATVDGRLLALRSLLAAVTGPVARAPGTSAVELGREAAGLLEADDFFRAITLQSVGMATWSGGDLARGFEIWQEAYACARRSGQPMAVLLAAAALASGLNDLGRRPEGEAVCRATLADFADRHGRPRPIAWLVRMTLGLLLYEANDLTGALEELEAAYESADTHGFGGAMVVWAVEYLALARQATGSPEKAIDAIEKAATGARATGVELPTELAEIEARLRLMQGDLARAAAWADSATPGVPPGSPMFEQMTADRDLGAARVRLAEGRPSDALALLKPVRARTERLGAVADLISVRVLEAGALEASGRRASAQRTLEEAIRLAAPGGYVRRLVDDGAPIAHLLPLVRALHPAFVDAAIAAFGPSGAGAPGTVATASARERLLEKLTPREIDVLALMSRGASDAQIAEAMVVSLATAKWHAANVRSKLEARNRTQAIARARELGLL
jgi:LuxR family maltose regulon positive regulatory protein